MNDKYPYVKKMKIGIEYEVIIRCLNPDLSREIFRIEEEVQKYSCYDYGNRGNKRNYKKKRDRYVLRVIRHVLAEYYHDIQKHMFNGIIKYNFQKSDGYKGKLCNVPSGIKEKTKSWQIQFDNSVKLIQEEKFLIKPYEKLNNNFASSEEINEINNDRNVFENIEIVSPPLDLKDDSHKEIINDVFNNVFINNNYMFHFNNSTTSNHIHFSCKNDFRNRENLYNICMNWIHFEPVFFNLCPFWRTNNDYCTSINENMKNNLEEDAYNTIFMGEDQMGPDISDIINIFQGNCEEPNTRYTAINLLNLVDGGIGTIEIRLKHGSNDPEELLFFIELFTKFFDASIRKKRVDNNNTTLLAVLLASQNDTEYLNKAFNFLFDNILEGYSPELKNFFLHYNRNLPFINQNARQITIHNTAMGGSREKKHYVFFYGSNNIHQINNHTGLNLKKSQLGTLHGFVRGKSEHWQLYPLKKGKINGNVVQLTQNQLLLLDKYENGYNRRLEKITTATNNKIIFCWVYY